MGKGKISNSEEEFVVEEIIVFRDAKGRFVKKGDIEKEEKYSEV